MVEEVMEQTIQEQKETDGAQPADDVKSAAAVPRNCRRSSTRYRR